jgi:hypothetical protein
MIADHVNLGIGPDNQKRILEKEDSIAIKGENSINPGQTISGHLIITLPNTPMKSAPEGTVFWIQFGDVFDKRYQIEHSFKRSKDVLNYHSVLK